MFREMICVACPIGCSLSVSLDENAVVADVKGNQCKRGETYAVTECTAPTRSLTTTVKVSVAAVPVLPVRSSKPIPKKLLLECMKIINTVSAEAPVKIGDVIIPNILDTGADIIATNDCPKA